MEMLDLLVVLVPFIIEKLYVQGRNSHKIRNQDGWKSIISETIGVARHSCPIRNMEKISETDGPFVSASTYIILFTRRLDSIWQSG